jgi:hypothetical protein
MRCVICFTWLSETNSFRNLLPSIILLLVLLNNIWIMINLFISYILISSWLSVITLFITIRWIWILLILVAYRLWILIFIVSCLNYNVLLNSILVAIIRISFNCMALYNCFLYNISIILNLLILDSLSILIIFRFRYNLRLVVNNNYFFDIVILYLISIGLVWIAWRRCWDIWRKLPFNVFIISLIFLE